MDRALLGLTGLGQEAAFPGQARASHREAERGQKCQPHRAWGGWQFPRAHGGYCVAASAHTLPLSETFIFSLLEVAGRAWYRCQSSEGVGRAEAACRCLELFLLQPLRLGPRPELLLRPSLGSVGCWICVWSQGGAGSRA